MMTDRHNSLTLMPVEATALPVTVAPFDIIQTFNDTTYAHRRGRSERFCTINMGHFVDLVATLPNEHVQLEALTQADLDAGVNVAPQWTQAGSLIVCGVVDDRVLVVAYNDALDIVKRDSDDQVQGTVTVTQLASNISSTGTRYIEAEPDGKLSATLVKGNRSHELKLQGSTNGRGINITYGDQARSVHQGQVDLCQHWHSLLVTSNDLGGRPEQSNQPRTLSPILSSFVFPPTVSAYSADAYGTVTGYSENPYATVFFNEAIRRYHSLMRIPGDLRTFSVQFELAPRDNRLPSKKLMLAPGEGVSFQLMFVQSY